MKWLSESNDDDDDDECVNEWMNECVYEGKGNPKWHTTGIRISVVLSLCVYVLAKYFQLKNPVAKTKVNGFLHLNSMSQW